MFKKANDQIVLLIYANPIKFYRFLSQVKMSVIKYLAGKLNYQSEFYAILTVEIEKSANIYNLEQT